ncbi:hypothetical protein HDU93_008563 [Gonapodya sp. JEL0774]|nr:hypothetical protein HDU93_008563 [Gonapodya sp. JEL0774]
MPTRSSSALLFEQVEAQLSREAAEAAQDVQDHVRKLVEHKIRSPGDDIVGQLVLNHMKDAEMEKEDVVQVTFLLFVAGNATVASMINLGVFKLSRRPYLRSELLRNSSHISTFVGELLRCHTASAYATRRLAKEDLIVGGVKISKGEGVMAYQSANRDRCVFKEPDAFDVNTKLLEASPTSTGSDNCDFEKLATHNAKINSISSMAALDAGPRGGMGGFAAFGTLRERNPQQGAEDDRGMNDPIIRDMLSVRRVSDVAPELEAERLRRMFVMLRHSKKYKRAQVNRANETWDRWNDQLQQFQASAPSDESSTLFIDPAHSSKYMQSRTASYAKASESSSVADFHDTGLGPLDGLVIAAVDPDSRLETSSINISVNSVQMASPTSQDRPLAGCATATLETKPRGFFAFKSSVVGGSGSSPTSPNSPSVSAFSGFGNMVRAVASKFGKKSSPNTSTVSLSYIPSEQSMTCPADGSRAGSMSSLTILRSDGNAKRKISPGTGASDGGLEFPSVAESRIYFPSAPVSQPQLDIDLNLLQPLPNMASRLTAGTPLDSLADEVSSSLEKIAKEHARKRSRSEDDVENQTASLFPRIHRGFVAPASSMCPSGLLDLGELEAALQAVSAASDMVTSDGADENIRLAPPASDDDTDSDRSVTSLAESMQTGEDLEVDPTLRSDVLSSLGSTPPLKGINSIQPNVVDLPMGHVPPNARPRTSGSVSSSRASISSLRHGILRNSAGTRPESRRDSGACSTGTIHSTVGSADKSHRPAPPSRQTSRPVSGASEGTVAATNGSETPKSEVGTLVSAAGTLGAMLEEGETDGMGSFMGKMGGWSHDANSDELEKFPSIARTESKSTQRHSISMGKRCTPSKRRSRAVSFDDHVEVIAERASEVDNETGSPGSPDRTEQAGSP